ncbi:hypothetical protein L3H50_06730 [Corynebacterium sp. MC-04]|uniref:Transposase n=1 Tax=Corynebacterium parakroppenstedtii TaxID=2828363 RepID=A0ABS9HK16_9CORY|nr:MULTISPECIES: hypothetical protein [Corynebacterium]KXB49340.1 hypothetical protein HMPREF1861_02104 [Corynebacterium kroppenstedtii]MBY0788699.1 hypothetical protein [Corynebacterium parakroppenstedtii]MBY0792760.1 hypothetical protein [Corynebacterium parakroppenstedtii]MBY0796861.1 hypothetical protein [Corynebacterium parakroppenstedtii]MCF6770117.1 hypothetical protein [Corynebacterium parakroppenstedtii]
MGTPQQLPCDDETPVIGAPRMVEGQRLGLMELKIRLFEQALTTPGWHGEPSILSDMLTLIVSVVMSQQSKTTKELA